jgi:predicted DNA-binding transcriptional regulator AlpA
MSARRRSQYPFHEVLRTLHAHADALPQEPLPAAIIQLAADQSGLAARLGAAPTLPSIAAPGDRLLTVHQAAEKLSVKVSWLYRNADRLPFTVRVSPRRLRFSEQGIEKYIAQRQAS